LSIAAGIKDCLIVDQSYCHKRGFQERNASVVEEATDVRAISVMQCIVAPMADSKPAHAIGKTIIMQNEQRARFYALRKHPDR
jgi:hypothetical protein